MTKKRLQELIKKMSSTRVLVVGDLILDKFIWGSVDRISPEAPVPVVWVDRESTMPGGAANVASNIKTLGGEPVLVGVVGKDAGATALEHALQGQFIETQTLVQDPDRPTIAKTRVIAHQQQVVRIDREKLDPLKATIRKKILETVETQLPKVDGIVVEDYGKGLITPELLKALVKLAKAQKKVIIVDPKEENFSFYKGVTALTPNKKEASQAAGINIVGEETLIQAGEKILAKTAPEALLITMGEEGMYVFEQKRKTPVHIPTVAQEVYDVSGAGDTVISVLTLARAAGASFLEAATMANAAAGVVVGKLGTATCSADELEAQMVRIGECQ